MFRFWFFMLFAVLILDNPLPARAARLKEIRLWRTHYDTGKTLLEVMNDRQQQKHSYSREELPMQLMSDMLWAAMDQVKSLDGVVKGSPTIMMIHPVTIYVALKKGLYRYEPTQHVLQPVNSEDVRWMTGKENYVKDAPINLIYVVDYEKMKFIADHRKLSIASAEAGAIAQNIYLFCAAFDLNTALRSGIDSTQLYDAMQLEEGESILFAQSVGISSFARR